MNPRLLVIAGPQQGAMYPIGADPFSVGRDPQNDLAVPDLSVSRKHCLILRRGEDFVVRDLGSGNGTLVNDRQITEQPLSHRDCITIGFTVLQFLTKDEVVFEEPDTTETVSLPADRGHLLTEHLAAADLQALLKVSTMLHSFRAWFKGRGSPARRLLERHLLSLILDVIPASRGAILLYEDTLDEPSSLSVKDLEGGPQRPVRISRKLVKRVLDEGCGLRVEDAAEATESLVGTPRHSLLLAPLLIRDQSSGVIYLEGVAFRETHLQFLVAISQVASVAMENAFHLEWLANENERLESELHPDHHMIGDSGPLRELQRNIARAAKTNSTVLIIGETGTGKELVARAIHNNSPRASKPFMAVNCAALSETLLESELFGHEKGSFTGANQQRQGKFEMAEGGTIFLDEIGDIAPKLQVDLLRVLQERRFYRVGGSEEVTVDVRVIAATHVNLQQAVAEGKFRDDLYYRLNVIEIRVPPLRERREDIPLLAQHFLERLSHELGKDIGGISEGGLKALLDHNWPGNVRELENAIERAMVTCRGSELTEDDFVFLARNGQTGQAGWAPPAGVTIEEMEKQLIAATLQRTGGNIKEAAGVLGIDRSTLYEKIKRYEIPR